MTGPEHYQAAERDMDAAGHQDSGSALERYYIARAQVHAALAGVALRAAELVTAGDLTEAGCAGWHEVTG